MSIAEVGSEVKRERKTREAESPRARFLRLAEKRVKRAINTLNLVGNLGLSGYESKPEEREKIVSAIFDKCHETKRRLDGKKTKEEFAL